MDTVFSPTRCQNINQMSLLFCLGVSVPNVACVASEEFDKKTQVIDPVRVPTMDIYSWTFGSFLDFLYKLRNRPPHLSPSPSVCWTDNQTHSIRDKTRTADCRWINHESNFSGAYCDSGLLLCLLTDFF